MILTKELEIKVQAPTLKYYRTLKYDVSIGDIIIVPIKNIRKSSNLKIMVSCDECGISKECIYKAYNKQISKSIDNKYRCIKCSIPHKMMIKYGVDHYSKTEKFKQKYKNTCLEKYGGHYNKLDEFKEKIFSTNLERYGSEYVMQNSEVKDKQQQKMIDLYGYTCPLKNPKIIEKSNNTMMMKYGSTYSMQISEIKDKIIKNSSDTKIKKILLNSSIIDVDYIKNLYKVNCERCNSIYEISPHMYSMRKKYNTTMCTNCNKIGKSGHQTLLYDFIRENYDKNIILNTRSVIGPLELDVYLPDINIAFEFNGLYWHSEIYVDKDYHKLKSDMCRKIGIQLIHIWEDDWIYKRNIVKSMILNKIGKTKNRIYARKCEIKEIDDVKLVKNFLEENHLQGFIGSNIKIGLFYDKDLVSLMTFGGLRKSLGQTGKEGYYEMLRLCTVLNTNIIGGPSKLFKYFLNNYNPKEIISYADISHSIGGVYRKIGFNFLSYTSPNYYYIVDGVRQHRYKFRKDRLVEDGENIDKSESEIMANRGIFRIYNSGNIKFTYKN
jgi:hypothetical protein